MYTAKCANKVCCTELFVFIVVLAYLQWDRIFFAFYAFLIAQEIIHAWTKQIRLIINLRLYT